jgi:serine/threonine protein kinase
VLSEDGLLRVDQAAQIGAQVADALAATHAAGIVHRDVKPANVLIGQGPRVEGLVKITDFGISHASGDVTLTQTGQITGTPAFLSPEVAQGHEPTPASDVFSLGATLYTCLEGTPPFGMQGNSLQQLHRVASGEIDPPRRCGALTRPLMRMLDADPAARPTMEQVRDELASLVARDGDTTTVLLARTDLRSNAPAPNHTQTLPPVPSTTPAPAVAQPPPPSAPPPARRRTRGLWVAVGALLAAVLVVGGLWLGTRGDGGAAASQGGTTTSSTASSSSPAPSSSAAPTSETAASTTTQQPTSSSATPPAGTVKAKDVEKFLRDYHSLVVRDPESGWAQTGPTLRSTISEQNYVAFWSQFSDVKLSGVKAQDGSLTATGQLEYRFKNGSRQTEQHQFTLVVGDDGQLLLDSDVQV